MKALTVRQPWAELIASGRKGIETRTWTTSYRGQLAIHAGKGIDFRAAERFLPLGSHDLSLGYVVALANLVDVQPMTPAMEGAAYTPYRQGVYGWMLRDVRRLPEPIPATGALGLWTWAPPASLTIRQ